MSNRVLCEIDPESGKVIRILRPGGAALFLKPEQVVELPKSEAVTRVRKQVFENSRGECRDCGKNLTWKFHMHELKPKGKGGEVSVLNSVALCSQCHIGKGGAHSNRFPQWSKTK